MTKKPSVCILMSTYNGKAYIEEQIESILLQKADVRLLIYIRDDGSNDGIQDILNSYSQKYKNIIWYQGKNVGPTGSFLDLLYSSPVADYYGFADQDDVWYHDKIAAALNCLSQMSSDMPCLYFCKKEIVNERLESIGITDTIVNDTTIGCAMINSVASGCTMLFNNKLMNILKIYRPNITSLSMHDAWVYRVAAAIGIVIYDNEPHMFYRQHGKNVVGADMNTMKLWVHRWKNLFKHRLDNKRSMMAKEIVKGYGSYLDEKDFIMIKSLANIRTSWMCRFRVIFSNYFKTQKRYEIAFVKVFAVLGWL